MDLSLTVTRAVHVLSTMTRLFLLAWTFCLLLGIIAASETNQGGHERNIERRSKQVTPASFGHLAINLGLVGATALATLLGAETAFHVLKLHKQAEARRLREDFVRGKQSDYSKDNAKREEEVLELLLDLADKQAQKASEEGSNRKINRLVVPKEIHQSLESVFSAEEEGRSNLQAYTHLKQTLAPLLEFEE